MKPTNGKCPELPCYYCKKPMVVTAEPPRVFGRKVIKMNCPDRCDGQMELTFQDYGMFWDNKTKV